MAHHLVTYRSNLTLGASALFFTTHSTLNCVLGGCVSIEILNISFVSQFLTKVPGHRGLFS